jgi:hypothetical protein
MPENNHHLKRHPSLEKWIIVSGLPRSGTSLMMMMLEAGGIPPLSDYQRSADADNPRGYYEFERVKQLPDGDISWLENAQGHAIKVITYLLRHLPSRYDYDVIVMERDMAEILSSQKTMMERSGINNRQQNDHNMAEIYMKHLTDTRNWLSSQENFRDHWISFNQLLKSPRIECEKLASFLDVSLDIDAMMGKIDPRLYRHKSKS